MSYNPAVCSICMNQLINDDTHVLQCGHIFHRACIANYDVCYECSASEALDYNANANASANRVSETELSIDIDTNMPTFPGVDEKSKSHYNKLMSMRNEAKRNTEFMKIYKKFYENRISDRHHTLEFVKLYSDEYGEYYAKLWIPLTYMNKINYEFKSYTFKEIFRNALAPEFGNVISDTGLFSKPGGHERLFELLDDLTLRFDPHVHLALMAHALLNVIWIVFAIGIISGYKFVNDTEQVCFNQFAITIYVLIVDSIYIMEHLGIEFFIRDNENNIQVITNHNTVYEFCLIAHVVPIIPYLVIFVNFANYPNSCVQNTYNNNPQYFALSLTRLLLSISMCCLCLWSRNSKYNLLDNHPFIKSICQKIKTQRMIEYVNRHSV